MPVIARVVWLLLLLASCAAMPARAVDVTQTIARVKRSVVAVGTFAPGRTPEFRFRGTGFAIGSGTTIVTNSHVLPAALDSAHKEVLAILLPAHGGTAAAAREVRRMAVDPGTDLALLAVTGDALPPLALRDSDTVREGQEVLMTGFPLGAILGPFPATHRGMISAITPIAIPQSNAANLNPALVHRLAGGAFPVFQLDATAYPGNSGSPIYDPATGEVLGIVNMVFVQGTKEAAISHPSGITYAVPAKYLQALLRSTAQAQPGK